MFLEVRMFGVVLFGVGGSKEDVYGEKTKISYYVNQQVFIKVLGFWEDFYPKTNIHSALALEGGRKDKK